MKNALLKISWENKPLPIANRENLNNLLKEVKTHGVVDVKKFNPYKDATYIKAFETSEFAWLYYMYFQQQESYE
jgi:hypothetical protein